MSLEILKFSWFFLCDPQNVQILIIYLHDRPVRFLTWAFLKRAPYCHSIDELVMLRNSEFISICTDLTSISLPFFTDDNCRLGDYKKLKTKMLDLHAQRYLTPSSHGSHENDMATRKHLVDMMFKRFDADGNGRVDSSELSQVRPN